MNIDHPIVVQHDDLCEHLTRLKAKSEDIKSRGGEMRKFSGQFNDDFGYNQVAKGMLMRLHNMTEEKRADCLRTLIPGLESMVPAWLGQATPDMFDGDAPDMDDDTDIAPPDDGEDEGDTVVPFDPDIEAESAEFDAAADEAMAAE